MSEGNLANYKQRARQEAEAATAAADQPGIASAHRLLAIRYEDRVRELSGTGRHMNSVRSAETIDG